MKPRRRRSSCRSSRRVEVAAIVALLGILGVPQSAAAHVPNIASFHLIPGEDAWRLEVHMATAGMHQALQALHPGEGLSAITPEAYETYLIEALREGIDLRVDGAPLTLDHPIVEVRAHTSRVVFVMEPPRGAHRLEARIDALSARPDQNNVLRFLGETRSRVVLKSDNDFRGQLELSATPEPARETSVLFSLAVLLVGLSLSFLALRRARSRPKAFIRSAADA